MTRIVGLMGAPASARLAAAAQVLDRFETGGRPERDAAQVGGVGLRAKVEAFASDFGCASEGAVAMAWIGRPRHLLPQGEAPRPVAARALAERFLAVGTGLLNELRGAFALAIYDHGQRKGFIATDRMGIHPVFFLCRDGAIGFGSSPSSVLSLFGLRQQLSHQAVFDYLYGHVLPAPRSIFEGVERLLPGQCIEMDRERCGILQYWSPRFDESVSGSVDDYRPRFKAALEAGVRDAMEDYRCGAFLSGGTDSSTIAGLMAQVGQEPPKTFSIGFAAAGFDEMEYARLASRHFGTRHHEYYVTPDDVADAAPLIAAAHPQPFGNSSALPAYFCARLARDNGVERMLGGDGGDELFGGNARYAKQKVFGYYEAIPTAMRRLLIEPTCHALAERGRIPGIGKIVSYVEQACIPMPERLETYNLLDRLGIADVIEPELLAQIDSGEPARLNRAAYFNPTARSLINRMLALDFKTTLADNDLPKVVQSCELAGLPVDFPMLDDRVVEFSLSLPPSFKLKGTRLRYFFKEALDDFLPEAIIRKEKHGFGLPFGQWAVAHPRLRALTFDTLNDLKKRRLVRNGFIDHLKDDLLASHPNYYGTMAWVLMTLEIWLQRHLDHCQ